MSEPIKKVNVKLRKVHDKGDAKLLETVSILCYIDIELWDWLLKRARLSKHETEYSRDTMLTAMFKTTLHSFEDAPNNYLRERWEEMSEMQDTLLLAAQCARTQDRFLINQF